MSGREGEAFVVRFGPGSSFSTLPPEAWGSRYVFGRCIAKPARCGGLCEGECRAADEHLVDELVEPER